MKNQAKEQITVSYPVILIVFIMPFWGYYCYYFGQWMNITALKFLLFVAPLDYVMDKALNGNIFQIFIVYLLPFLEQNEEQEKLDMVDALKFLLYAPLWVNYILGFLQISIVVEEVWGRKKIPWNECTCIVFLGVNGLHNLIQTALGYKLLAAKNERR